MADIKVQHREILENSVYTPCEIAALLKISNDSAYKLLTHKKIIYFRVGTSKTRSPIRVLGSELLEFIKKNTE